MMARLEEQTRPRHYRGAFWSLMTNSPTGKVCKYWCPYAARREGCGALAIMRTCSQKELPTMMLLLAFNSH